MTTVVDFRDLLATSVGVAIRVWGVSETMVSPESVRELARLGSEATFLNAVGWSAAQHRSRLSELWPFLETREAADGLSREGERWRVRSVLTAAAETLRAIQHNLVGDATPARVGWLLRALPMIAASKFTVLGQGLAQVLGVEPDPETLMVAYGNAFCRRDEEVLAAVDRVILDDRTLGPLVLELAGRLMVQLGYDGLFLTAESREALIDCLALLFGGGTEKVGCSVAGLNGRNAEEEMA